VAAGQCRHCRTITTDDDHIGAVDHYAQGVGWGGGSVILGSGGWIMCYVMQGKAYAISVSMSFPRVVDFCGEPSPL